MIIIVHAVNFLFKVFTAEERSNKTNISIMQVCSNFKKYLQFQSMLV